MGKTKLTVIEDKFYINGRLTYEEIDTYNNRCRGLLMNARFIQGVFDDKIDPTRFNRFGKQFDPEENTKELVDALQKWYDKGLRAITVGMQGGGPCFTIDSNTIDNNPFYNEGKTIDERYLQRMESIIKAADEIGMIVIVSYFYMAQGRFFADNNQVRNAVIEMSKWIKKIGYQNIIIEVENEFDYQGFKRPDILMTPEGIIELMELARQYSGGILCGCSETGGHFTESVAQASDIILIHGNSQSPQQYYNLMMRAKAIKPKRPIVCNEDSQAISRLDMSVREGISWGYYNNITKQEPPTDWGITKGEDEYFARRMAMACGLEDKNANEQEVYLQGLEEHEIYEGKAWIRLASLYPEKIEYVRFFRNDKPIFIAYDEPFLVHFECTWLQRAEENIKAGDTIRAEIHFRDESIQIVEKTV